MSDHTDQTPFEYEGFSNPNGTIVPDDVFDVLMPQLTDAELRILLYIIRRTFGFKKNSDEISLRQMVDGIITRDGRVLDHGTGLSKPTVARGLIGLRDKRIIATTRNRSAERGNEATTYRLRFKADAEAAVAAETDPRENAGRIPLSHQRDKGLSHQRYIQQTVKQQTEEHLSKSSKDPPPNNAFVDNLWTNDSFRAHLESDEVACRLNTPAAWQAAKDFVAPAIRQKLDRPSGPTAGEMEKPKTRKRLPVLPAIPPEEYDRLVKLMRDWSVEMGDRQHVNSNTTHAMNIMLHTKWDLTHSTCMVSKHGRS